MSDGFSLDVDKARMLVLADVYKDLLGCFERSGSPYVESELHGLERALKIVGIDPEMLKGVDTSC